MRILFEAPLGLPAPTNRLEGEGVRALANIPLCCWSGTVPGPQGTRGVLGLTGKERPGRVWCQIHLRPTTREYALSEEGAPELSVADTVPLSSFPSTWLLLPPPLRYY